MSALFRPPRLRQGMPAIPAPPAGPLQSTMAGMSAQLTQHLLPFSASVPRSLSSGGPQNGAGSFGVSPPPSVVAPPPPPVARPPVYGGPQNGAGSFGPSPGPRPPSPSGPPTHGDPPGVTPPGVTPPAGTDYQALWRSSPEYLATHPGLIAEGNRASAKAGYSVHIDPTSGLLTTGDTPQVLSRGTDPTSTYWANLDALTRGIADIQRSANARGLLFSGSNAGSVGMANTGYQNQQATNFAGLRDALGNIVNQENANFQRAKPTLVAGAPVQGKVA